MKKMLNKPANCCEILFFLEEIIFYKVYDFGQKAYYS